MRGILLLTAAFGLSACGGADPLTQISEPEPEVEVEAPVECTALGNGCPNGQRYEMCCSEGDCAFWFTDGTGFLTLEHALTYCRSGSVPAGVTPTYDDPRDGTETREGRGPPSGSPNDPDPMTTGGTDGGQQGNNSSSSGACYGNVPACQSRYSSSECSENPGCAWTYEGCFGSSWACQSFYSPSQCGYQLGCGWDHYYEQCTGGAASCSTRSSSGSCNTQRGCWWRDGECNGGAWQCGRYTAESSCRAVPGCYWR